MSDRFIVDLAGTRNGFFKIGAAYAVLTSRIVSGTAGEIVGGGDLSADRSLGLADTGVSAGSYGNASSFPNITVDSKGRITSISVRTVTPAAIGASPVGHSHTWTDIVSGAPTAEQVGADPAGTASAAVAFHVSLSNPHPQYDLATSSIAWNRITGSPTTVAGYGIVDAVATSDSRLSDSRTPSGAAGGSLAGSYPNPTIATGSIINTMVSASAAIAWSKIDKSSATPGDVGAAAISHSQDWSTITGKPTTVSGYGITDSVSNSVSISGVSSISGGGDLTANRTMQLVGDVTSPGVNYFYGTDAAGTRGWYTINGAWLPGLATSGIVGNITFTKLGTTARIVTFQDAAYTAAGINIAQTFSALQTFGAGLTVSAGTTTVGALGCTTLTASGAINAGAYGSSNIFNGDTTFDRQNSNQLNLANSAPYATGVRGAVQFSSLDSGGTARSAASIQLSIESATAGTITGGLEFVTTSGSSFASSTRAVMKVYGSGGVSIANQTSSHADPGTSNLRVAGNIACTTVAARDSLSLTKAAADATISIGRDGYTNAQLIGGTGADGNSLKINTGGSTSLEIKSDHSAIIGTDPGGSELLRVGGSGRFSGELSCANNLSLTRSGALPVYIDSPGIGNTLRVRTSSVSSLDTTAIDIAPNGAATFGGNLTVNGAYLSLGGRDLAYQSAATTVIYGGSAGTSLTNGTGAATWASINGSSATFAGRVNSVSIGIDHAASYAKPAMRAETNANIGFFGFNEYYSGGTLRSRAGGSSSIVSDTANALGFGYGALVFRVAGNGAADASIAYTDAMRLSLTQATFAAKLSANSAAASSTLTGNSVAQVISWLQTVFA